MLFQSQTRCCSYCLVRCGELHCSAASVEMASLLERFACTCRTRSEQSNCVAGGAHLRSCLLRPSLHNHQRSRQPVRGCDTCKPTLRCSPFKRCSVRLQKAVLLKAHPGAASSARDTEFVRAELEKAGVPRHRITAILKRYPTYTSWGMARFSQLCKNGKQGWAARPSK